MLLRYQRTSLVNIHIVHVPCIQNAADRIQGQTPPKYRFTVMIFHKSCLAESDSIHYKRREKLGPRVYWLTRWVWQSRAQYYTNGRAIYSAVVDTRKLYLYPI